jgi:hypothetical protein
MTTGDVPGLSGGARQQVLVVANEFVNVEVRLVETRNGVRLEILSPRRGTRVWIDATVLDGLTWQDPDVFSQMLSQPPGS